MLLTLSLRNSIRRIPFDHLAPPPPPPPSPLSVRVKLKVRMRYPFHSTGRPTSYRNERSFLGRDVKVS